MHIHSYSQIFLMSEHHDSNEFDNAEVVEYMFYKDSKEVDQFGRTGCNLHTHPTRKVVPIKKIFGLM